MQFSSVDLFFKVVDAGGGPQILRVVTYAVNKQSLIVATWYSISTVLGCLVTTLD
jgi:hypothetical protein